MTEQSETKKRPDKREHVTGRLRHALDLMVFGDETGKPLDWNEAGRTVNISARSMRRSLERHAVRKYLMEQKQVLRACLSAKSLARLDEIAGQKSNYNAAVNAIRQIDEGDPEALRPTGAQSAGVVIKILNVVQGAALPPASIIEVTPRPDLFPPQPARVAPPDYVFRDPRSRGNDE